MSDLKQALDRARAGGPERHHEKSAQQGKLPVRERIARLLDSDSFAEEALLDKTTMVTTLDGLERAGLARRVPSPTDRRARLVETTAQGEALVEKAATVIQGLYDEVLGVLGADRDAVVDGHTAKAEAEWQRIVTGAASARAAGLEVHAGHGLDYQTAETISALPEIAELNIGYFMMGEALFVGLGETVRQMRAAMDRGRQRIMARP